MVVELLIRETIYKFAHLWLGASLAIAPIAAWIALRGAIAWPPVFLGLAVFFWVAGFDIIYACQDAEFDRATGLRSIPAQSVPETPCDWRRFATR